MRKQTAMNFLRLIGLVLLVSLVFNAGGGHADEWGGWRGPTGDGVSLDPSAPLTWNGVSGEDLTWRCKLPGTGHSSPVVWNTRVFLTTCDTETNARQLICVDRDMGNIRWRRTVIESPLEIIHKLNSHASSTPATDGEFVFVTFLETEEKDEPEEDGNKRPRPTNGTLVVACYSMSGDLQWIQRPSPFVSLHGFCSNPIIHQDLVIVNGDHDGKSAIFALDRKTGVLKWKHDRVHGTRSFSTPIIRRINDQPQLILAGSKRVLSLDPNTGKPLWWIEGPTEQFVASVVEQAGRVFAVGGFPTHHAICVSATGSGDVSNSQVVWHVETVRSYVPSPVVADTYLFVADDKGLLNCLDIETGERIWRERICKHVTSSLIQLRGHVVLIEDSGVATVIKPGPVFDIVAKNPLGEACVSSPAISDGQWFIRGEKHLYCFGDRVEQSSEPTPGG